MLDVSCLVAFSRRLRQDIRRERHFTSVLRRVLYGAVYVEAPGCPGVVTVQVWYTKHGK